MRVVCVERSALRLARLKKDVRRCLPEAEIAGFKSSEMALASAKKEGCDILLTDIDLGADPREGYFLAQKVKAFNPRVNIIFVTVYSEAEFAQEAFRLRVSGFVPKPYRVELLEEEFRNLRYQVS